MTTSARLAAVRNNGGSEWSLSAAGARWRSAIVAGISATLMMSAIAFGGTTDWAVLGLRTASVLLLAAWMMLQWSTGAVTVQRNAAYVACLAFALAIGVQLVSGSSVYRYITGNEAAGYCAYAILFFVASEVLGNERLTRFMRSVAIFGAALAFFAILQKLSGTQKIYWLYAPQFGGQANFGPYTNRNHYCGLMEMLWPFALLLGIREGGVRRGLLLGAAGVMLASVFLSGSRGGAASCAVQILIAGIFIAGQRRGRRTATMIWGVALLLMVAGGALGLGSPATLGRLINTDGAQRTLIYRDTLRMWLERPWLGFGWGTFPVAYPRFRSFYSVFFINQTHNDYLQVLVECGIAGFGCAAAFIALTLRQGISAVRRFGLYDAVGAGRVAAMLGIAGILVHSLVDFNLHIPANAALFAVLCGVASRPSDRSRQRWRRTQKTKEEPVGATMPASAY